MSRVVADTENLFDDCCCPSGSPKVPSKPVGFGTFGQKLGDLGLLFGGKPWLRTRSRVAAQCFGTSFSRRFEPLAYCPRAHTLGESPKETRPWQYLVASSPVASTPRPGAGDLLASPVAGRKYMYSYLILYQVQSSL